MCDNGEKCGVHAPTTGTDAPPMYMYSCILEKFCGVIGFITHEDGNNYNYGSGFTCQD